MSKVKKVLLITGLSVLILITVLMLFLGHFIKAGVNTMGPKLAGVPVAVEKVVINPLTGIVRITGLVIGNPAGFSTPSAMELGDFKVKLNMSSLFTDVIVIEEILISKPQITYERGLRDSNLGRLQQNLKPPPSSPRPATPAEKPTRAKGEPKKVIIEDFQFNGAEVHVALTALGDRKATLPLPPIRLQEIGRRSNGATVVETVSEILKSITGAVIDVAASAGGMAGDLLKDAGGLTGGALKGAGGAAGDAAKDAAGAAKDAADSVIKGVGGLFGK